jgi:hypothetical protein
MLRWQLSQASGVNPARTSDSKGSATFHSDHENDRCITAKHNSIYPNRDDVSVEYFLSVNLQSVSKNAALNPASNSM